MDLIAQHSGCSGSRLGGASSKIGRQDLFDRGRRDAEVGEGCRLWIGNVILLHQNDLVARDWALRQGGHQAGQKLPNKKRNRYQQPLTIDLPEHQLHQRLVGVDPGSTELVDLALRRRRYRYVVSPAAAREACSCLTFDQRRRSCWPSAAISLANAARGTCLIALRDLQTDCLHRLACPETLPPRARSRTACPRHSDHREPASVGQATCPAHVL
jgi:hypothetical protein